MNLKRIDTYEDHRFSEKTLMQHGCFLTDGEPYEIEIISASEAIVRGKDRKVYPEVISEFRFYTPHICRFYNQNRELVKEFEPKNILRVDLTQIQPSQLYIDRDKISAISSFIHKPEDIIVQILPAENRFICLDGHTRLCYAVMKGWDSVYAVLEESDELVYAFVKEAVHRKIYTPMDMELVSHEEYETKWNRFCDELLEQKEGESCGD